jgi:hypothetical protein
VQISYAAAMKQAPDCRDGSVCVTNKTAVLGAQTKRLGGRGPLRNLLAGETSAAVFFWLIVSDQWLVVSG